MAPEILSLRMFEIGEGELTNSDIVNRYACADVYSFSLIAWLILSQCPALWDERPNERRYLENNIDDYMFEEFMRQAFNRDEYQRRFDTGNIIQKGLSVSKKYSNVDKVLASYYFEDFLHRKSSSCLRSENLQGALQLCHYRLCEYDTSVI